MKKIILVFTLTAICNLACMAQSVSKAYETEFERYFSLTQPTQTFKNTFVAQFQQFIDNGTMAEEEVLAVVDELVEFMLPEIKKVTKDFLTGNFSVDELRQINDFYATPTGHKMQELMPVMTTEMQKSMTKPEFMEKMMQLFSRLDEN